MRTLVLRASSGFAARLRPDMHPAVASFLLDDPEVTLCSMLRAQSASDHPSDDVPPITSLFHAGNALGFA